MTAARKAVPGWLRAGASAAFWAAAVLIVQSTVGIDIARDVREGEERIEHRIQERRGSPACPVQPRRTDEESIESWELVSV